jgi:hypothetical protein
MSTGGAARGAGGIAFDQTVDNSNPLLHAQTVRSDAIMLGR